MNIIGTIYIMLFIVLVALTGVYQGHLSQNVSPMIFLFFSASLAFITFFIASYVQNGLEFIKKGRKQKLNLLFLNIGNFLTWSCYVYAIKYLEPAVAVIIANAIGPILIISVSKFLRPNVHIYRIEKISAIAIALSLCFIVYSTLTGKSAFQSNSLNLIILGLILTILTGIGQVLFSIFSKKLSESGFLATEILAWRYPLVILYTSLFVNSEMFHQVIATSGMMFNVIVLSVFGMVVPVYFYQKGVKLVEPVYISVLYITEPVIMFIGQIFDPRLHISIYSYIGVGLICFFSLLSIIGRYYGVKSHSVVTNQS